MWNVLFQTLMNVTVPSELNCTSPSFCWTDGNLTWTLKNVSQTFNIAKCRLCCYSTALAL